DADLCYVRIEVYETTSPLNLFFNRVPHHSRSLLRIVKLIDQRLDCLLGFHEHAEQHCLQREVLDSLRSPFGFQFGAWNAPHFLGIGFKKNLEQPFSEAIGYPMLERLLLGVRTKTPFNIAEHDQDAFPEAKSGQRVKRFKRIIEEFLIVIDPR